MTQVYGVDGDIPGFSESEPITIQVNGVAATTEPISWQDDKATHLINADTEIYIYLPMVR